jgi:poly(3-hydroxyalkanoate) synthetase
MGTQKDQSNPTWATQAMEYGVDAVQRSILYWDVMRKRGNVYLEHLAAGQPPVLVFDYETILDGRELDPPVNYSLVRIIDRREAMEDRRETDARPKGKNVERRQDGHDRRQQMAGIIGPDVNANRPVLIIDPRAGHGPGIGGSKLDSQIGMALNAGHPVYFLVFTTRPVPEQTLADVWRAEIGFVEEIRRRHPDAPKPAVIGNCQGGWAAALIGAQRPDITGPMAFNGSPLSYWGGVEGVNPMRYLGGLVGGAWTASLLSDLGNGFFDGANLVANFENLNPANTFWTKQYNVYSNVDTEEKRFLDFEKWWGGFFLLTAEEISTIVNGLFIGNKLEHGQFELERGECIDLNNFKDPIVLFASFGDNITPPQQALNWVVKVYGSSEEIKRKGQVIVMILHEAIGHLGIFVSAKIARKQHKEIIASFDMLEFLPPGLYEMIIEKDPLQTEERNHRVRFVERHVADIMAFDDGPADEEAFYAVKSLSDFNNSIYRTFVRPWVKCWVTALSGEVMRQLHPLRVQRYAFSDLNPLTWPLKVAAPVVAENRQPRSEDNIFVTMERAFSHNMTTLLDAFRNVSEQGQEFTFRAIYDNPWMKMMFPASDVGQPRRQEVMGADLRQDAIRWRKAMCQGGAQEATVRILLAIMTADRELAREEYETAEAVVTGAKCLKRMTAPKCREMVKEQARMLQVDKQAAMAALPGLLPRRPDRQAALEIVDAYTQRIGRPLNEAEQEIVKLIERLLKR